MHITGSAEPLWAEATDLNRRYSALDGDLDVDLCVIGGGIAGLTAALHLKREGRAVAVLEGAGVGRRGTARSAGRISTLGGLLLTGVADRLGSEASRLHAQAGQRALERIRHIVAENAIDCGLEFHPAYAWTADRSRLPELERDVELLRELGLRASLTTSAEVPFPTAGAVRLEAQAQLNPAAYLAGLAAAVDGGGGYVFEGTAALEIRDGEPVEIETENGVVTARHVIVATQEPLVAAEHLRARMRPHRRACLGALVDGAPDCPFDALDEAAPSVRSAPWPGGRRAVLAVASALDGTDVASASARAEAFLNDHFPGAETRWHWDRLGYEGLDGMPLVGRPPGTSGGILVAAGYARWALTHGTAAGMLLAELMAGRDDPLAALYDPGRAMAA